MDADERAVREEWKVKEEKNYQSLCQQAQISQNKVDKLTSEIEALEVGFRKQKDKYGAVEKGKRGIVAAMGQYASDTLKESLSLGLISTRYKPPHEFEVNMQFARQGYSVIEGLKGFTDKVEGGGEMAFLTKQVNDFFTFMDTYPVMGKFMVTDLAIALSSMQDQTPYETLLNGLRARGYTQAMLGSLGRNVEIPPELTAESVKAAFKWKAMADIATRAPQGVHVAKGLANAAIGAVSMNPGRYLAA